MSPALDALHTVLLRDLRAFQREVTLFPDDASLWRTLPGISNSAGNLALHVSGNLQHFLGTVLGGTGYRRDRESEFSRRTGTREEVVGELERAAEVVRSILPDFPEGRLQEPLPVDVGGGRPPVATFLVHLVAHLACHLGQAGYLRRASTDGAGSAQPVSVQELL